MKSFVNLTVVLIILSMFVATSLSSVPTLRPSTTPVKAPSLKSSQSPSIKSSFSSTKVPTTKPSSNKPNLSPSPKPSTNAPSPGKPSFKPTIVIAPTLQPVIPSTYVYNLQTTIGLGPRVQWENNDGYCGETSTIMAGLVFGQYFSQYDLRIIYSNSQDNAGNGYTQYLVTDTPSQDDQYTATQLRLNYVEWDNSVRDTTKYLAWVKYYVRRNIPVTICILVNGGSDQQYDHIVTVLSITSKYNDDLYHADDIISFDDHYSNDPNKYLYTYTFSAFQATRSAANKGSAPPYSLLSNANQGNFGIAHTGVTDPNKYTLPVRVSTNLNYESPVASDSRNSFAPRPTPVNLLLTVTVLSLTPGVTYNIYKFTDEKLVPTTNFNSASTGIAVKTTFTATTSTYSFTENITSNQKAIYRCVSSTSP